MKNQISIIQLLRVVGLTCLAGCCLSTMGQETIPNYDELTRPKYEEPTRPKIGLPTESDKALVTRPAGASGQFNGNFTSDYGSSSSAHFTLTWNSQSSGNGNGNDTGLIKIISKPEDRIVKLHGTNIFVVVAEAKETNWVLTFQWQKNGVNIVGANGPSFLDTNVLVADVGFYTCIVGIQGTGQSVTVKGNDDGAPGARLFAYTGANTSIAGPYQPGSGSVSCVGSYVGKVTMMVPNTSTTWYNRPAAKTGFKLKDITNTSGLPGYYSKVSYVDAYDLASGCGGSPGTPYGAINAYPAPDHAYQFTIWVTSGTLPLGTPLELDIVWGPTYPY